MSVTWRGRGRGRGRGRERETEMACKCRFHLDEEEASSYCSSSQTQLAVRNMGIDPTDDYGIKRSGKMRKCSKRGSKLKTEADDSNYPRFAEEDYIVFCFREDGAFDVVKDGKSESPNSIDFVSPSARLVNRKKLIYGEEATSCSIEETLNGDKCALCSTNDGDFAIPCHQKEEDAQYSVDSESHIEEVIRKIQTQKQDDQSSNSSQSNRSSGSFAFPVLGWEWSGSPVKMPKPGLQLRKHKSIDKALLCVAFQCCRF